MIKSVKLIFVVPDGQCDEFEVAEVTEGKQLQHKGLDPYSATEDGIILAGYKRTRVSAPA